MTSFRMTARFAGLAAMAALTLLATVMGPAAAQSTTTTTAVQAGAAVATEGHNPPGNNGTVKVDRVPFDDHPNNEPHAGCTFQVDFYGFDEGDQATVTFTAHPPTLREGTTDQVLLSDTLSIGEDDASGGGSEEGLDASATYTLDLAGITPHSEQGYHVKLTVTVASPQAATPKFRKHKLFWVSGCGQATTTTAGGSTTSSTSGATTTTGGATTSSTGGATTTSGGGGVSTTAAGGATPTTDSGGSLPFTGSNLTLPLLAVALGLLAAGGAALRATRRRGSTS